MELFAGLGPAPGECSSEGGDRRFPEPPTQHGDSSSSSMLVIRDALLSQLQRDRLRQEIIVAELAKIERAMALLSADAERAEPGVPFPLHEQMPHSRGAVGPDHDVAADVDNDLNKKDEKPATEALVRECLKTADAEKVVPNKDTSSSLKWSCAICRVEAPTEGHLQQHFVGQKHRSKVVSLVPRNNANGQKAKATAEKPGNARPYDHKTCSAWVCRFCQSNCNCKSDLENHLRGKRHKAKIQALLEEYKIISGNYASPEADSLTWNCSLCQAKCTCQSDLANHLRGKRHLLNFLVLQVEAKQYLSEWCCAICQAKCNSVSQFEDHCISRGHQEKVEALQRGGQYAGSGSFKTANGASSEGMDMHRTYFCKLCNLHCNSKNTLAEHRKGKKHKKEVEKRTPLSFCEVCNLQCNSEKMLDHHRSGKTHLAKLRGC